MIDINKLLGFYELMKLNIPTVRWKEYTKDTVLDDNHLWTIRVAVIHGSDLNLPRAVGITAAEGDAFAEKIHRQFSDNAVLIYYPYFIAEKSGTLQVSIDGYVLEAVHKDLWNLVTYGKRDITIISHNNTCEQYGDSSFFNEIEISELLKCEKKIRNKFMHDLRSGTILLLEWSFAIDTDSSGNPIDSPYLLFYECRTL
jgi:hypothetical protein